MILIHTQLKWVQYLVHFYLGFYNFYLTTLKLPLELQVPHNYVQQQLRCYTLRYKWNYLSHLISQECSQDISGHEGQIYLFAEEDVGDMLSSEMASTMSEKTGYSVATDTSTSVLSVQEALNSEYSYYKSS